MRLLPRAQYLTKPLTADGQQPLPFDPSLIDRLPTELTSLTGQIWSVRPPEQGCCNLTLFLDTARGTFVLKVAKGGYRSQELSAEHTVLQWLYDSSVPVSRSLVFVGDGELGFQLREYSAGEPLSKVMTSDQSVRPEAIRQAGRMLSNIHQIRPAEDWTWDEWIGASLQLASRNFSAGVLDPDEFTPDEPPNVVLDWLHSNKPNRAGDVCLLHGDYRPKNLLWQDNSITSVIDWAFVDVGDPYYDLSIFHWYMRDEAEWRQFIGAYGLDEYDQERLEYFTALQKFLNV